MSERRVVQNVQAKRSSAANGARVQQGTVWGVNGSKPGGGRREAGGVRNRAATVRVAVWSNPTGNRTT